MKGKKVFYIAMFFAIIFMLFRCEGRDSREYLEERIGIPISRVYPTQNLERSIWWNFLMGLRFINLTVWKVNSLI